MTGRAKWVQGTCIAPNDVRNAIAKLVVECASDAKAQRRLVRGGSRRKGEGWWAAGKLCGLPFQQLQKVCRGHIVRQSTVEKVRSALVAVGALRATRPSSTEPK